jgi:hypothetical protein
MIINELFNLITKGDIKNSIYTVCKILLEGEISIDFFEETLIALCSYIGTFINIYNSKKYIDVINNVKNIIVNENIVIKDILLTITKMCILCEIYNKHPMVKAGNSSLPTLRKKIIDIFENNEVKLSHNGINKFEGILPPIDSENYNIALLIISSLVYLIKKTDNLSIDDSNKIQKISEKLRNCFEYISKKKYTFETKFYSLDNDSIWFLWGIISILYNDDYINNAFYIFNYNWKKTYKQSRIGILWGVAILLIYSHKKDISYDWDNKEINIINKIDELALTLYNEVKTDLSSNFIQNISENKKPLVDKTLNNYDSLEYIYNYIPCVSNRYSDTVFDK